MTEDGGRLTAAGGAGAELALTLIARLCSDTVAREVELEVGWDPRPVFAGGHPRLAGPEVTAAVRRDGRAERGRLRRAVLRSNLGSDRHA